MLCDLLYRGTDFYVFNVSRTYTRLLSRRDLRVNLARCKVSCLSKTQESKSTLGLHACGLQAWLVLEVDEEVPEAHDSVSLGNFASYLLSIP